MRLETNSPLMARRLRSIVVVGVLVPCLSAILLCGFASLWPVRMDARALQDLAQVQSLGLPQSSGQFVFLSRDNSIESARIATFGLKQLAFPAGSVFWAALKEESSGPWPGGFTAIDQTGSAFVLSVDVAGDRQWIPVQDEAHRVRERTATNFVIYDSNPTREMFEERWPFLKASERVAIVSEATVAAFTLRRPASEFTLKRIVRIGAVIGSYLAVLLLMTQLPSFGAAGMWLISTGSLFLTLGLNISLTYLLQWVTPEITHWSSVILWVVLLTAALLVKLHRGSPELSFPLPSSRTVKLVLIYCVAVYGLLFLVRLDFDGDFFNNWLPQARFHYLLGQHDPMAILGQGSMQGASYPPGYGIVLSSLMWVSGMPPAESFLMGPESSFAILIYRLLIFTLNAAMLLMVVMHLRELEVRLPVVWIACLAVTMLLIPTTAGRHIGAETVLFPMLASSIVMIAAGQKLESPGLTAMGLAVGGMATLIKWEATLIFALAVMPWIGSRSSVLSVPRMTKVKWAAALTLSLIPVIAWKATLTVHNEFFVPVTWVRFVSSAHLLPGLASRAARGMIEDGRLLLLLLALPCAVTFRFLRSRWIAVVVPFGIASLITGFVVIFAFASMNSNTYLDTSYSRLVMVPIFGAILYCAETAGSRVAHQKG